MTMTVNIKRAKRMAFKALLAGIVPMLWGPPAVGKSAIVKQIADENNLLLIDERLSDCDPSDLKGFPFFDPATGKGGYRPMETFPIEGDALPINPKTKKPYEGWLLFLDELTNADDDVKKAAYKLILDRMIGQKRLHEKCAIVCAGNGINDGAMATELGTALQSRVMHIEVELDFKTWMEWAIENGIEQYIRDYLNFANDKLYTFKPDHTDKTFSSPRTWVFADRLIKTHTFADEDMYGLLAGAIGPGVAAEFMNFCLVYKDLPKIADIIAGPEYAKMPEELSSVFAMCGTVAAAMNVSNADKLMIYVKRMSPEYIIVTMMDAIKRDPALKTNSQIRQWAMQNGSELF